MSTLLPLLLACAPEPAATGDSGQPALAEELLPPSPAEALLPATMDLDRLLGHLDALQAIADAQGGTRQAATAGFDDSAAYAVEQLQAAGYTPAWQEFPFLLWQELSPPLLQVDGLDTAGQLLTMRYSPPGEVQAEIVPVDLVLPPGDDNSSTSGCEPTDFDGFPAGRIALLQRGTCPFSDKAEHAQAAGASGVILFNEGQAGRQDVLEGTLGSEHDVQIPVLGASFALGEALAAACDDAAHDASGVQARLVVDVLLEERPTWNLWADLAAGEDAEIVVIGAHLDSVQAGPGINDNGSGAALVLELAAQAAALDLPRGHTLRFALWGAEEAGLIGSFEYVGRLTDAQLDQHRANLNFDMVASPNGARFVYDGDDSDDLGGWPGPAGSAELEALFTDWLDAQGLAWQGTAFDGRSDYGPFIYQGIPAGGLFSGAEGLMSEDEASTYDGVVQQPYDACYHQGCDTRDNVDPVLFLELSQAAAYATEAVALDGSPRTARIAWQGPDEPPRQRHCGEAVRR